MPAHHLQQARQAGDLAYREGRLRQHGTCPTMRALIASAPSSAELALAQAYREGFDAAQGRAGERA